MKEKILIATIQVFNRKGLKLTMDDIAREAGMSKKTIYTVFEGKDELFSEMVDFIFGQVAQAKADALEKGLAAYLAAMPEGFEQINLNELFNLKDKYPKVYKKVRNNLESNWEPAIQLLEDGKTGGEIRQDANLAIFRMMMESALVSFFERDTLKKAGLSYNEGLTEVVNILLKGIEA